MDESIDEATSFARDLARLSWTDEEGIRHLKPERELCDQLGISRGTLRERLRLLETFGMLERIQGRGTVIKPPDASGARIVFGTMRELGYLNDSQFAEVREALETSQAGLAAMKATPADIEILVSHVDNLVERAMAGDLEGSVRHDLAFHTEIARIAGNPVYIWLSHGLAHVLRSAITLRRSQAMPTTDPVRPDTVHYEVAAAIATRDPRRAEEAMRQHFLEWSLFQLEHLRHPEPRVTG